MDGWVMSEGWWSAVREEQSQGMKQTSTHTMRYTRTGHRSNTATVGYSCRTHTCPPVRCC